MRIYDIFTEKTSIYNKRINMKKFIKQKLRESLEYNRVIGDVTSDEYKITELVAEPATDTDIEFRFNNGSLNKSGHNTIYADDEAIVDFGIGRIGTITIAGTEIPNALYLKGGYNASAQGRGYGSMGLHVIFTKLPKINNLILQCYDTACPFWEKMGGEEITSKEISPGNMLRTLVVTRDAFYRMNSI